VGQLDQGLGPVTHQIQHLRTKRFEPRLGQVVPGILVPLQG
jgi:hypothetical protein